MSKIIVPKNSFSSVDELYSEMYRIGKRIDCVLNYIKENPTSDPNAFEMNDLMFDVSHVRWCSRKFETSPYQFLHDDKMNEMSNKFYTMMNIRMEQLKNGTTGLDTETLYNYFDESLLYMETLNSLGEGQLKNTMNSLCGVNLYCKQRIRDCRNLVDTSVIIYENHNEYQRLSSNLEELQNVNSLCASSNLKATVDILHSEVDSMYNRNLASYLETKENLGKHI